MKWKGLIADNITHTAGVSILSLARGVFAGMRSAWCAVGLADYRWALLCISSVAIATQTVHRVHN